MTFEINEEMARRAKHANSFRDYIAGSAKGRPKKQNKNIKFSCTLTPAQLEWLNKTADELGIERSAVLRNCIDEVINEQKAKKETY